MEEGRDLDLVLVRHHRYSIRTVEEHRRCTTARAPHDFDPLMIIGRWEDEYMAKGPELRGGGTFVFELHLYLRNPRKEGQVLQPFIKMTGSK